MYISDKKNISLCGGFVDLHHFPAGPAVAETSNFSATHRSKNFPNVANDWRRSQKLGRQYKSKFPHKNRHEGQLCRHHLLSLSTTNKNIRRKTVQETGDSRHHWGLIKLMMEKFPVKTSIDCDEILQKRTKKMQRRSELPDLNHPFKIDEIGKYSIEKNAVGSNLVLGHKGFHSHKVESKKKKRKKHFQNHGKKKSTLKNYSKFKPKLPVNKTWLIPPPPNLQNQPQVLQNKTWVSSPSKLPHSKTWFKSNRTWLIPPQRHPQNKMQIPPNRTWLRKIQPLQMPQNRTALLPLPNLQVPLNRTWFFPPNLQIPLNRTWFFPPPTTHNPKVILVK